MQRLINTQERELLLMHLLLYLLASPVALVVKNLPASEGGARDLGLISRLRRSSGGGHGNPFQYSCLENPMDRGALLASVHGVTRVRHD